MPGDAMTVTLSVDDLRVTFPTSDGDEVCVVRGVSFAIGANEVLSIVGESGSGKTSLALAVMGLLPASARVTGEVMLGDTRLRGLADRQLARLRGARVAMVFQDALGALNPVHRVGDQVAEAITTHRTMAGADVDTRVVELLDVVGIPDARASARCYPHELSGGMRQRVVIAMAIANDPDVLIADEPTTALDVTIQAQVLDVIRRVKERTRSSVLLITHDFGVVAGLADRVAIMYGGRLVEAGDVDTIFYDPTHPYTRALLAAMPRIDQAGDGRLEAIAGHAPSLARAPAGCSFHPRCAIALLPAPCATVVPELSPSAADGHQCACHRAGEVTTPVPDTSRATRRARPAGVASDAILEVRGLAKHFPARGRRSSRSPGQVHAVCGVSFDLGRGATLALVGESGSGKTTTARLVLGLLAADGGSVRFCGQEVVGAPSRTMRDLRRHMQVVFQDPYAALNPRLSVGSSIAAPLRVHGLYGDAGADRVAELLEWTALDPSLADRYPSELSGGQRQRVCIARALGVGPELVVLDEPVSALDVSVRAGIINLLEDLQARLSLSYLLIAHDLTVVRHTADAVAVMYLGKIVEIGTVDNLFHRPSHPYTQALLSASPLPDPRRERTRTRILLTGDLPNPVSPPSGCRFRTRCWKAQDICAAQEPALLDRGEGHQVACHFPEPPDLA